MHSLHDTMHILRQNKGIVSLTSGPCAPAGHVVAFRRDRPALLVREHGQATGLQAWCNHGGRQCATRSCPFPVHDRASSFGSTRSRFTLSSLPLSTATFIPPVPWVSDNAKAPARCVSFHGGPELCSAAVPWIPELRCSTISSLIARPNGTATLKSRCCK